MVSSDMKITVQCRFSWWVKPMLATISAAAGVLAWALAFVPWSGQLDMTRLANWCGRMAIKGCKIQIQ